MSFASIKTESEAMLSIRKICRLCLSEESLSDVLDEEDLHQWIRDYLSITISPEDRISQNVCTICQIRLSDFHQFRISCHEVQTLLQSMTGSKNAESRKYLISNEVDYDAEQVRSTDLKSGYDYESSSENHQQESCNGADYEEAENGQQIYLDKTIHVEEIKIEASESEQSLTDYNSEAQLKDVIGEVASFKCEICYKKFSYRWQLSHHNKLMHKEKEYECSVCGIGFAYRANLNQHFQTRGHINKQNGISEVTPVKCDECERTFALQNQLNWHKKVTHGAKNLSCKKPLILAQHIRRHDCRLEKVTKIPQARKCDICQKVFKSLTTLTRHKREIHEAKNVASYECDICQKAFKRLRALKFHKTDMHGPKIFICPICSSSFTARYRLDRHMPVHGNQSEEHLLALQQKKSNGASSSSKGQDKAEANIKTDPDADCISSTGQPMGQDTAKFN